ncbi:putative RNA methyltransferase [Crossiella sp. NPDC003009]
MISEVLPLLACPHCGLGLAAEGRAVRCAAGHSFDVARQGYLSLLAGDAGAGTGDTAAMVAARAEFLGAGHFRPVAAAVSAAAGEALAAAGAAAAAREEAAAGKASVAGGATGGAVVDLGAGTGYYLGQVLRGAPEAVGLALDLSKFAARRAAREHPRLGAVVCDAWRRLPVRDGVASVVLNVFAPRNGPELARILAPGGRLVVVTPEAGHLGELVAALGLLRVDEGKAWRVEEKLGAYFTRVDDEVRSFELSLAHRDIATVVGMGPSAWHTDPAELAGRIGVLPEPCAVSASVRVAVYRRACR